MITLHEWQKPHAEFLLNALRIDRAAGDTSDTGTGKTVSAAWVARQHGEPIYIVCPLSVIPAWKKWLPDATIINYEKARTGKLDFLKKQGKQFKWSISKDSLIIFDEVHLAKSTKSLQAQLLAAAKPHYVLMLSATMVEDPMDLRSIGYILGLHNLKDFWPWALRNGCRKNSWGGLEFTKNTVQQKKYMALIHDSCQHVCHGIKISELGDAFPKNQVFYEEYDFDDKGRISELYGKVEKEIIDFKDHKGKLATLRKERIDEALSEDDFELADKLFSAEGAVKFGSELQEIELLKLPLMLDKAKNSLAENKSLVIFLNYVASADWMFEQLKEFNPAYIRGGGDEKEEQRIRFQENKTKVAILTIRSGGVGITLSDVQGGHPRTSIISPTPDARQLQQCFGRCHRADSKTPVLQYVMCAAGTIESRILSLLTRKLDNQRIFNDGAGIRESAKKLDSSKADSLVFQQSASSERRESEIHKSESRVHSSSEVLPLQEHRLFSSSATLVFKDFMSEERPHAEFSPSSYGNLEKCPGYRSAGSSVAGQKGTMLHECVEKREIPDHLDPTDKQAVQDSIDFLEMIEKGALRVEREQRVDVLSQFGYFDELVFHTEEHVSLFDMKFVKTPVTDAEENLQGKGYCLGVWDKYPKVNQIDVIFWMPYLDLVSTATFTRAEHYPSIREKISSIIDSAKKGGVYNPGSVCDWCGAKTKCPTWSEKALQVVSKYDSLPIDFNIHSSEITDPSEMAKAYQVAVLLEKWCDSVKKHALDMRLSGIEIPGYEKVERSGRTKVTIPQAAWDAVKDVLTVDEFTSACDVSIAKLKDLVGEKAPRGKKDRAKAELEDTLINAGAIEESAPVRYLKKIKHNN